MKRRQALTTLTLGTSAGLILPSSLFTACQSDTYEPSFFKTDIVHLLNEIAETILPTSQDSKGAGNINVARFLDIYANECLSVGKQEMLTTGVMSFQSNCQEQHGQSFIALEPVKKHNYLIALDGQARNATNPHYFSILKELILFAYFTSKEGAENALNYLAIPGKYDGDIPYEKGDKAWALA